MRSTRARIRLKSAWGPLRYMEMVLLRNYKILSAVIWFVIESEPFRVHLSSSLGDFLTWWNANLQQFDPLIDDFRSRRFLIAHFQLSTLPPFARHNHHVDVNLQLNRDHIKLLAEKRSVFYSFSFFVITLISIKFQFSISAHLKHAKLICWSLWDCFFFVCAGDLERISECLIKMSATVSFDKSYFDCFPLL